MLTFFTFATKKVRIYRHLFIDLDRTLWDFDANAADTLHEIFDFHGLADKGVSEFVDFQNTYQEINTNLWNKYRSGIITKQFLSVERFRLTMERLNQDTACSSEMCRQYLTWSPEKTKVFPGVMEVLNYLKPKYKMHILTNGFNEVQFRKIERCGFSPYFDSVITSDDAGFKKPTKEFFDYALQKTGAKPDNTLMIGDDEEVDIIGAQKSGIDQVFVNYNHRRVPDLNPTFEIHKFSDLKKLL